MRFQERVIPLALLALSICIYVLYIIPTLLGTPNAFTAVTSNSMEPTLEQGDLAIISGYNGFDQVQENDIIVYSLDNWGFVVHRVVEKNSAEKTVRTMGDANSQMDRWTINYDDILGKVVFDVPYIGYIVMTGKAVLKDFQDLGIPSPAIGGTLTILAVILLISGMESPPWETIKNRSKEKQHRKEVREFLDSEKGKTKIENDHPPSQIYSFLRKAVKSLNKEENISVVKCDDEVYLVNTEKEKLPFKS